MEWFTEFKTSKDIDLNGLIQETLNIPEVKKSIIEYNQDQLSQGIDANGLRIETIAAQEQNNGYPYSKYTVKMRGEEGLQVHNVDLKVTGELWKSMEVIVNSEGAIVKADTKKGNNDVMDNFEPKYDFWGLTQKNKEGFLIWDFLDYFLPFFEMELQK
jgi:hypothetical protein